VQQLNSFVGSIVEDRYRIEEELGAGAMGVVYRGRHIKVGRVVAIKVLHDHLVQNPEMVARFEREAMIAAKLRHKNLVSVIDIGATESGERVMVLEYAPGVNLATLVEAPLPRERVVDLTRQLLHGLEHAHALDLVHRDLKPENILVEQTPDGRDIPRIVDFGIAVLRAQDDSVEGRRLTSTGMVLGTPMYMSPEHARGEQVDARTDLFSLGVIVYEMLAGKPPFEGTGVEIMIANIMQDPPSVATRTGADVDPLLEAFARKLMARELSDRFASATAALEILDLIARDRDAAARALGLATAVPEPRATDRATTRRHAFVRSEHAPLAKPDGVAIASPTAPCAPSQPPRRATWGVLLGAAAILAIAFGVVLWMDRATDAKPAIVAPHVEVSPSPVDVDLDVRGTAMLPSPPPPPPSSTNWCAPGVGVPMTPPVAVTHRVVIASAGDIAIVVERFAR
jgi:serine/threonine-protein kinase